MRAADLSQNPIIEECRKSINPPYTRKDFLTIAVTVFILLAIPITVVSILTMREPRGRAAQSTATGVDWVSGTDLIKGGKIEPPREILEVNFSYKESGSPVIKLGKVTTKQGYAPKYNTKEKNSYTLQILDKNNKTITKQKFSIPKNLEGAPPLKKGEKKSPPPKVKNMNFTITVVQPADAKELQIVDQAGKIIEKKQLAGTQKINNKPNFHSIKGNEFFKKKKTSFWQKGLEKIASLFKPKAALAQVPDKTLDIVFIGDKYTAGDLTTFHNDVTNVSAKLLNYEPFKSRSSQIAFNYVDNTADLGCAHDKTDPTLITCNWDTVWQKVDDAAVPYDNVYILVKDSVVGGTALLYQPLEGGQIAVGYNGTLAPMVFVHEFGHSFAGLLDEYNEYSDDYPLTDTSYANCYAGLPPSTPNGVWNNLVGSNDYVKGCYFSNFYRPSSDDIMMGGEGGNEYFNSISQYYINVLINLVADTYSDSTNPSVSIVSPTHGSTVSGTVPIQVSASDNKSVAWVQLWIDSSFFQTSYVSPFPFSLNTQLLANGTHTLQFKAYDAAGNIGSSAATAIIVNNSTDNIFPTNVSITSPANGASVSGKTVLTATASDNMGVAKMEFYDGTTKIGQDLFSPFEVYWQSNKAANGTHQLTAKAYDAAGNVTTSSAVSVTVNNTDTQAPTTPANLSQIGGTYFWVELEWNYSSDNVGVVGYWVLRNGLRLEATDGLAYYEDYFVKPSTTYVYQIIAFDAAGNESYASNSLSVTTPAIDTQDPVVTISSPTGGSIVSNTVSITANATDAVSGIYEIAIFVDRVLESGSYTVPYTYSWDTSTYANGSHTIVVAALDNSYNMGSATVTVTVHNTSPPNVDLKVNGYDGPLTVAYNSYATISWSSHYATSCTASGSWTGTKDTSGYESLGYLTSSKTYTITCSGDTNPTAADTVVVNVSPPRKTGDLNGDGVVNIRDFGIFLGKWNTSDATADFNHDGIVNIRDFGIFLGKWGT